MNSNGDGNNKRKIMSWWRSRMNWRHFLMLAGEGHNEISVAQRVKLMAS
jgi:hypothetical protein